MRTPLTPDRLAQFTGTERLCRHAIKRNVFFTDGAKYVADRAAAYWLLNKTPLIQPWNKRICAEAFQVWKLRVNAGCTGQLVCEDGNDNIVYTRASPSTDRGRLKGNCARVVDLFDAPAGDVLEVTVRADGRGYEPLELRFAFRPLLLERFAFGSQVFLHAGERFDNRLDPLAKAGTDQIPIDQSRFFSRAPRTTAARWRVQVTPFAGASLLE